MYVWVTPRTEWDFTQTTAPSILCHNVAVKTSNILIIPNVFLLGPLRDQERHEPFLLFKTPRIWKNWRNAKTECQKCGIFKCLHKFKVVWWTSFKPIPMTVCITSLKHNIRPPMNVRPGPNGPPAITPLLKINLAFPCNQLFRMATTEGK